MTSGRSVLEPGLAHDWARKYFDHVPEHASWEDHLSQTSTFLGTALERIARSAGGFDDAVLAARNPRPGIGRPRLLWHGRRPLLEEAFHGWFGPKVQRVRTNSFRTLLERMEHFLIADASTDPTYVVSLPQFVRLGASHSALEMLLGAKVVVATEGLYSRGAHVGSLRVYAPYDGSRYAESTRKLFYNAEGVPVSVESIAREVLARLGYDAVHPNVFRRLFQALVGRSPAHFAPAEWPHAFLAGKLSPLEWLVRARERLEAARAEGVRHSLDRALAEIAKRPFERLYPGPPGSVPYVGRYLSRARYESLLETVGDRRLLALFEGILYGYSAASADWFAWQAGTQRAFLCEVKSSGDTLRPYQKESILWCQRVGCLDYRLLEVIHNAPAQRFSNPGPVRPRMRTVLELLRAHVSVRDYAPGDVEESTWQEILRAGQQASTDATGQLYSAIDVRDPAIRDRVAAVAGQAHVRAAPRLLVVCLDVRRLARLLEHRGERFEMGPLATLLFGITDAALFAQNLCVAAEANGLGVCYLGGVQNDPEAVVDALGLPAGVVPLWGLTFGRPAQVGSPKPRLPTSMVVHQDRYRDASEAELGQAFEAMRSATRSGDWLNPIRKYFAVGGVMSQRETDLHRTLRRQGLGPGGTE